MLAQFSIWALDDPHLRDEMETIRKILDARSVKFDMNRMATTIEGSFEEITAAVGACHTKLAEKHQRLLTKVTIDDDRAG